jgi:predicted negative regulator of RcsB-dependent stress response
MEKIKELWNKIAGILLIIAILLGIGYWLAYNYQIKPLKAENQKQKNQIEELLKPKAE